MNDLKRTSYIWTVQRIFLVYQVISALYQPFTDPIFQKFNTQKYTNFTYMIKALNFLIHSVALVMFQSHPNLQFVIIIAYLQRILTPPITCVPGELVYSYAGKTCFFGIFAALCYRLTTHRFLLQKLKLKVRAARVLRHPLKNQIKLDYYLQKHQAWQKRRIYQNLASICLLFCQIGSFAFTRRVTQLDPQYVKSVNLVPNWSDHLFLVSLLLNKNDACIHGSFLFAYCFALGLIIFNSIFAPFFKGDKIGEVSELEDELWTEDSD